MRLLNLAFVAVAAVVLFADYLQEKKRLAAMQALPPARARARFESGQRKRERVMVVVTVVLAVAAAASWTAILSAGRWRS
jgi:hypothetical protein